MIKETYAPIILKRKAAQRRKETGDDRWWCRYDQRISITQVLKTNLSRPFIMTATEPILWFWDLYIAVVYGILYLCFVAYPIIFTELRGWSPGISGLGFCGIGLGTSKHYLFTNSRGLFQRNSEGQSVWIQRNIQDLGYRDWKPQPHICCQQTFERTLFIFCYQELLEARR